MDVAKAEVDILAGSLVLALDAVDGADCNHSVHTAEVVHTYVEEAEGSTDDADGGHHAADGAWLRAWVGALHAYAFPCAPPLAFDIPCVGALFLLPRRRHLHLSPDSCHCACRLPVHSMPSLRGPEASTPYPPIERLNHARMARHSRFASVAERAKKRTCYTQFCSAYDSPDGPVVGTRPSDLRNVYDHLWLCATRRTNVEKFWGKRNTMI